MRFDAIVKDVRRSVAAYALSAPPSPARPDSNAIPAVLFVIWFCGAGIGTDQMVYFTDWQIGATHPSTAPGFDECDEKLMSKIRVAYRGRRQLDQFAR